MNLQQLKGRRTRLREELLTAYCTRPLNTRLIDRVTDDLVKTERDIKAISEARRNTEEPERRAA